MNEMMLAMLIWIGGMTGYVIDPNAPPVKYTDSDHMKVLVFEENAAYVNEELVGVYDEKANILYLSNGFEPDNVQHQAVLAHELAHFTQFRNIAAGLLPAPQCKRELEPVAYRLANRWLEERGLPPSHPEWLIARIGYCSEETGKPYAYTK